MIPYSRQNITEEDITAVSNVLASDFLTQGPEVPAFEQSLKDKFLVKYAVACSSGTSALHLAYASLGVNSKTVGIVPAITFAATANAFRYLGAKVQFCDIDPCTGLICLNALESILKNLKPNTTGCPVVISPVSFAGAVAPLEEIKRICSGTGFRVVEDASHSPGAFKGSGEHNYGSGSCAHSDAACLSFHPVKHICCGEGGAVLTNNEIIGRKAEKLRSHGIERPYGPDHETPWFYEQTELGWNYRLTDIQATLGRSQLARLDHQLEARRKIAESYDRAFSQPSFTDCFDRPMLDSGHAWHLYIIRFKHEGMRDRAHKFLKKYGVITQVHYIPLYRHPYYTQKSGSISLPGAEKYYHSCLSIPMFPTLTPTEQDQVIRQLEKFCGNSA